MKRIKVLHFIHGMSTGGAEVLVKDYLRYIDKKRFELVLLCLRHFNESPYEKLVEKMGIKVIYVEDFLRFKSNNYFTMAFNFVKRYMEHCNKLGIEVFCFSIESNDCSYCLEHNLSDFKVLGYDYVDVDMCTSCLYEDITSDCLEYRKIYSSIFLKLNKHLLFDSIVDMEKYLEIRAYAKTFDFDIEEYFNPLIVRVGIKVTQ